MDAEFAQSTTSSPDELLFTGLGWGALENLRCTKNDISSTIPAELPFKSADIGVEQQQWLELLENGVFPNRCPSEDPGQYMIQPEWCKLLECSITSGKSDHWFAWYHLGVMRMENLDPDGAKKAWKQSHALTPNAWSLRNLAILEIRDKNDEVACNLLRQAWEIGPKIAAIAVEYAHTLRKLDRYETLRDFLDTLPNDLKSNDRILMLSAWVAIHYNQFEYVEKILEHEFATIREGELSLTQIWFEMNAKKIAAAENIPLNDDLRKRVEKECPPPTKIDFRMFTGDDVAYVPPQQIKEDK